MSENEQKDFFFSYFDAKRNKTNIQIRENNKYGGW